MARGFGSVKRLHLERVFPGGTMRRRCVYHGGFAVQRRTLSALFLSLFFAFGCSSSGDDGVSKYPKVGEPCGELGSVDCSTDNYDRSVVVICAVNEEGSLKWRSTKVCDFGCKSGHCTDSASDVRNNSDVNNPEVIFQDSNPSDVDAEEPDVTHQEVAPDSCVPNCTDRVCGDDGCGGLCGECSMTEVCIEDSGTCCQPACSGKSCGDNGCGGLCGECPVGLECNAYHQCAPPCEPNCEGRVCGPDGCGDICGTCPPDKACGGTGQCTICLPMCEDKECGPNGCGGLCGACPFMQECVEGVCQELCVPNCAGKECGPDGCNDVCGTCLPGETCVDFQCTFVCEPQCDGKVCGPNGCGGNCGKCPPWAWCTALGQCETDCVPNCLGEGEIPKVCGSDGCGGSCGSCPISSHVCSPSGTCLPPEGPCETVPVTGWCDGNILLVCVSNSLTVTDCDTYGKNVVCEWLA